MAIAFVIIPIYFIDSGISVGMVGIVVGVASIPVTVKFIWGGIVDFGKNYGRKMFIILGSVLLAISMFGLFFINPATELILFTVFLFISLCGTGFLDVSSDAWAIEIGEQKEIGKINGSMIAGQYGGMAVGSIVFTMVASQMNYPTVFLLASIIFLIIIVFPLLIKETIKVNLKEKMGKLLVTEFKQRQIQNLSFLALILWINRGILLLVVPLYMRIGLNLEIGQIGLITAVFPIASAIGSIVGGAISDIWQRKQTLIMFIWISIVLSASFIFAHTWIILAVLYTIFGFLQGAYLSVSCALYMDNTNQKIAATQYSIFTSLGNTGMMAGETVSGTLIAVMGFSATFLYSAWIFGPSLILLHFIKNRKK